MSYVSNVTYHVSHVTYHLSLTLTATATDLPLLTPQLFALGGRRIQSFQAVCVTRHEEGQVSKSLSIDCIIHSSVILYGRVLLGV